MRCPEATAQRGSPGSGRVERCEGSRDETCLAIHYLPERAASRALRWYSAGVLPVQRLKAR